MSLPCPASDTAWLYLVRHGATKYNLSTPPVLQGRGLDPPLCEAGVRQAEETAELLASAHIDAVYASPMLRARQTGAIIAQAHGLSVEIVPELTEVDVGVWEGYPLDEIRHTWPEEHRRFVEDAGIHPFLGGENLAMVQSRVTPAIEGLLAANAGRVVLVVAHNMVNRAYLANLLQVPLRSYRNLAQDNCAINLLRRRDGVTRAMVINSTLHLREASKDLIA